MKDISKKEYKEQYAQLAHVGGIYRITCNANLHQWILSATNLKGAQNRFAFCVATDSCPELFMQKDWSCYHASSFSFEILEEVEQTDTQTNKEFANDIHSLLELWREKNATE